MRQHHHQLNVFGNHMPQHGLDSANHRIHRDVAWLENLPSAESQKLFCQCCGLVGGFRDFMHIAGHRCV